MTSPATWGTANLLPAPTTTNNLVFAADNAATASLVIHNTGSGQVTLEKLHFRLQRDNAAGASADRVTIALESGDLSSSGPGIQTLSTSSGAYNYDFNLSGMLTDATLAPGESATFSFNVTPTDPAGTNRRVRVDNLAFSGIVTNDYYTWAQLHSVGAAQEDDDLDGLSNDFERLFGLDPQNANSRNPIASLLSPATGQFSYTRRTRSLTGKSYTVWYSTDMVDWFEDTNAQQVAGTPSNGIETVTVTLNAPLLLNDKLFVKLSADDPAP